MFVGIEKGKEKQWICNLHENQKDGKYWVHDAIAYAVYLCSRCFEPNIRLNHA